jgi:aromatic-L-amino-acid decarboxylase
VSDDLRAPSSGDIPPATFRRVGRAVIDQIADYLDSVEQYPVFPSCRPGEIRAALPGRAPEQPEELDAILDDVWKLLAPGLTHWNSPRFMAYFAISGSGPGILGEALSAAFNVNAMLWHTGPAATELEELVMAWLRDLLGLPGSFDGHITDTASVSTLLSLAAAREAVPGLDARRRGLAGRGDAPRLRVYCSEQAHVSVDKAAVTLGVGLEGVRRIPTDADYRMNVAALASAVREDRAAGWHPMAVAATLGTTSTTSCDPVSALADLCSQEGMWLHVDAAYAGSAAICPEMRHHFTGWERADSVVVNPHKWLFTPIDCSALYCRRPDVLKAAFSLVPDYLRTSEDDAPVHNFMDYGVQMGRRFRALKLWMVIRSFGAEGLRGRIREHIRLGQEFAGWIDEHDDFERLAPVPFSTVCFRHRPRDLHGREDEPEIARRLDELNERLLERVNRTGRVFLSHTRLRDRHTLRLTVGNIKTERRHVEDAWQTIEECAGA